MSGEVTVKDSVKEYDKHGAFFQAVRCGDIKTAKHLLKSDGLLCRSRDERHPFRHTALHVAIETKDVEMVSFLLSLDEYPVDVNSEDIKGTRPVWMAAKSDCIQIAELLLERRCEVNFVDVKTGWAPIHCAVLQNNDPLVKLLVKFDANVNLRRLSDSTATETPLMMAVQMDNQAICQTLINSLCDLNATTTDGFTALHYAVAYRRYQLCEVLLENRANIHCFSNNGISPLTVAVDQQNPAMVKLLARFGYNLDLAYQWKETPLEHAIRMQSERCAMALVHGGCSLFSFPNKPSYFYQAMAAGLVRLGNLLLGARPLYSQENWIRSEAWPLALYLKPDVCKRLLKHAHKPPPLKKLCRAKVLRTIGQNPLKKLEELSLPTRLSRFLTLNDYFKKNFYAAESKDAWDCPFTCPALCEKAYCPSVHISDDERDVT